MFIKQVANHVVVFNDDLKFVKEFEESKIVITETRILIIGFDKTLFCDMPKENTAILK